MYRTDRADSTYHKENVICIDFLFDPTIRDLRHQFRMVSFREIPYSDMDYGGLDPATHTPEALDVHPSLSGESPYRATAWQMFTAKSVQPHKDGSRDHIEMHFPTRLPQRDPGPGTMPYARSTNWFEGLTLHLASPRPKTMDENYGRLWSGSREMIPRGMRR
ncbi:hypothetical protein RQP46_007130 [Phenoliferia psychrophenolica]